MQKEGVDSKVGREENLYHRREREKKNEIPTKACHKATPEYKFPDLEEETRERGCGMLVGEGIGVVDDKQ